MVDWANILGDRNVQQLMAGMGTALDPEGAGGIIGQPTQDMIATQAQQSHLEELLKALGSEGKLNIKPDGSISMQTGKAPAQEAASALGGLGGMESPLSSNAFGLPQYSQVGDPSQLQAPKPAAPAQQEAGQSGGFQNLVNELYQNLFGGM